MIHKSIIEVNEKGTEVKDKTNEAKINYMGYGLNKHLNPRDVIFDRPFKFVIYDTKHKVPIFTGKIEDPGFTIPPK